MAITEPRFPGWSLHRHRGEAYPYICPFTNAQLVAQYSGATNPSLNIAAIMPAGSFVQINGQNYVTRSPMRAGQFGEIDPLDWNPSYIMPKKSTDVFIDRASVYWDATNNYATSTSSGNTFIGYAVLNDKLSLNGTTTSGSTLTGATLPDGSTFDGQTKAYTVTGGTSGDAVFTNYGSGDKWIEVQVVAATTINVSGGLGAIQAAAGAGSVIANATALSGGYYRVTGGNNAVGVVLTSATATKIINGGAGGLFVYPPVGGTINALSANSSLNMATLTVAEFTPTAANGLVFYSNPLLPS